MRKPELPTWAGRGGMIMVAAVLVLGVLPATAAQARPLAASGQVTPTSINFDPVPEGGRTTALVTVTNIGNRSMRITGVGTTFSAFVIDADNCVGTTLRPGRSCQTTVAFAPALGLGGRVLVGQMGYLSIPDAVVPSVDLRGVALPADGHGPPIPWIDPGSVDFGTVPAGEVVSQTVTLTNVGGPALYMGSNVLGEDPDSFTTDGGCQDAVLEPGDSCTATAWYAPRRGIDSGVQQANLWFLAPDNTIWAQVSLTGTAS
jgi:HYDIN/CFA65/VesB-like, Ig-like domain